MYELKLLRDYSNFVNELTIMLAIQNIYIQQK